MARKKDKSWERAEEIAKRIRVSHEVLGDVNYQPKEERPVLEGVHYDVLAYTDWGDVFVPTIVKWNHGEVDDFISLKESKANAEKAKKKLGSVV